MRSWGLSVSSKSALALGLLATLCFAAAAWLIANKASEEQQAAALRELQQLAVAESTKVRNTVEESLAMVRGMTVGIEQMMASETPNRASATELVRRYTEADPLALGYWLEFEANGFDGRDAELVRAWPDGAPDEASVEALAASLPPGEQTTKDSGRLSVYWIRSQSGEITLEHSLGPEADVDMETEDYYVAGRDRGSEMMFEPYEYEVEGKNVLMTSLMTPLRRQGRIVGVAGADLSLDQIQSELAKIKPYGRGVVRLLSSTGMVLAAPETNLLGKSFPQSLEAVHAELAQGKPVFAREFDQAIGEPTFRVYVPLKVGRADDVFMLMVAAPESEVLAGARAIRNQIAWVGVISVLVLAVAVVLLLRTLVGSPLAGVVQAVQAVARGQLDYPIQAGSRDEVGAVARALQQMQSDLAQRIEAERLIAAENLRIRIALDNAGTAMLISNAEGKIAYANPAMRSLLKRYQSDLGQALPMLDPTAPQHNQLQHLEPAGTSPLMKVDRVVQSELRLGSVTFAQTAAPVISEQGERLGVVLEWRDLTQEVEMQSEVARVIEAASQGDLGQRVSTQGKEGFFLRLAEGVNGMLRTNEQSIAEVQALLSALAQGDLTRRIETHFSGVFGAMRDDSNTTVERLTEVMRQVRSAVDAINTAASEIASGNSDLSARSEQQAASLEQTAASMEELTSTVKQNAESSREAGHLVVSAAQVAERGGKVVNQVVEQMHGISAASKQIENITGVIDGIAFQTNILALNAAVEAARAGEQGRGFAVVASEVRQLAQRSQEAAKEIKTLIAESVGRVEHGAKLTNEAGETMSEVVDSVQRVKSLMSEITAASDEQAAGIEQVNQAITHMDGVTQQNAALVEEATASASALEDEAHKLSSLVSYFRLQT
ncbi:methyl-accepting chemotaxis protein [Pseudomarimonas arenosa]|uniref:HAMP domain-containing protein n=1 Tax=Pseudomarimonas arenosa TaxID=2774145 RepID=A0AAW3ZP59_9GAMM|nr:methyl-accepting chemotaxis protein [Pseudomarimonas arenosa]MBD8526705.1 HAMP domain-containing protein [Pseudomarimonas arenosa]